MATYLGQVGTDIFVCKNCGYQSSHKGQYERHLTTLKHKRLQMATHLGQVGTGGFVCDVCSKKYAHRSSLWKHKKQCTTINVTDKDSIIINLLQQNAEL